MPSATNESTKNDDSSAQPGSTFKKRSLSVGGPSPDTGKFDGPPGGSVANLLLPSIKTAADQSNAVLTQRQLRIANLIKSRRLSAGVSMMSPIGNS